jgi:hypothetical protein
MQFEWILVIAVLGGLGIGIAATILTYRLVAKRKSAAQVKKVASQTYQRRYHHSERLQEVYKLLTTLTATLSYQRVLDKALDLSMVSLTSPDDPSADRLVSAVLLFKKEEGTKPVLYMAASRRLTRSDLRNTFTAEEGVLKKTIDEGAALLTRSIAKDPELGRIYAFQSCKAAYCIP